MVTGGAYEENRSERNYSGIVQKHGKEDNQSRKLQRIYREKIMRSEDEVDK